MGNLAKRGEKKEKDEKFKLWPLKDHKNSAYGSKFYHMKMIVIAILKAQVIVTFTKACTSKTREWITCEMLKCKGIIETHLIFETTAEFAFVLTQLCSMTSNMGKDCMISLR